MFKCEVNPNHKTFYANATVRQEWLVNEDGDFLDVTDECAYTVHPPDDSDDYICKECDIASNLAKQQEAQNV